MPPLSRVYPRVCGGTDVQRDVGYDAMRLSPRMRGNRGWWDGVRPRRASIPAYAGEPEQPLANAVNQPVYPRVCGGTAGAHEGAYYTIGLSPRMRGNPRNLRLAVQRHGSIPAYAGEPPAKWMPTLPERVYPRVCGGTAVRVSAS